MVRGTGHIAKKCSCKSKTRCPHGWTIRWHEGGTLRSKTFRDEVGPDGKVRYGSGKRLAEDFAIARLRDERAGERTFIDQAKGSALFTDYCAAWIERGRMPARRAAR
jgi:hypothetical protein